MSSSVEIFLPHEWEANVLTITVIEYPNEQRWCLQGRMVGRRADDLRSAWREARQDGDARRCIVELKLTLIDRNGEAILAEIMVEGAAFIASGAYTSHVLSKICVDAKWRKLSLSAKTMSAFEPTWSRYYSN